MLGDRLRAGSLRCNFGSARTGHPARAYRVTLTAEGRDVSELRTHHHFNVRPAIGAKPDRILQVAATGSWTAYNTWGGSNHYSRASPPPGQKRNQYATTVSLERAWCRVFVVLPKSAPRVPPRDCSSARGSAALSPHGVGVREWLLQQIRLGRVGKLRPPFLLSLGPNTPATRWISRASTSCISIRIFSTATLALSSWVTDEYWTWEMRDAVDRYVERGGHAARFAGNFMWQTRLERTGKAQVCYKYRARAEDPVYESGPIRRAPRALGKQPRLAVPER